MGLLGVLLVEHDFLEVVVENSESEVLLFGSSVFLVIGVFPVDPSVVNWGWDLSRGHGQFAVFVLHGGVDHEAGHGQGGEG